MLDLQTRASFMISNIQAQKREPTVGSLFRVGIFWLIFGLMRRDSKLQRWLGQRFKQIWVSRHFLLLRESYFCLFGKLVSCVSCGKRARLLLFGLGVNHNFVQLYSETGILLSPLASCFVRVAYFYYYLCDHTSFQ